MPILQALRRLLGAKAKTDASASTELVQALRTLSDLLLHEATEMDNRVASGQLTGDWRIAHIHKARTFRLVRDWIQDLQLGTRPGQGGYSAAARQFHEHGKPLPSLDMQQRPATQLTERPADLVTSSQLDSVEQLKRTKIITAFSRIAATVMVTKNQYTLHGRLLWFKKTRLALRILRRSEPPTHCRGFDHTRPLLGQADLPAAFRSNRAA